MFITNNAFRSPISSLLGNLDAQYWTAAELALCRPWFLVKFRYTQETDDTDTFEMTRTMLLSNLTDVELWALQEQGGSMQLESVLLVSPGHLNGTDDWKMEPLSAIWTAEEPSTGGQIVDIYETRAGVKYVHSMLETQIEELRNETLRFRFTAPDKRSGNSPH